MDFTSFSWRITPQDFLCIFWKHCIFSWISITSFRADFGYSRNYKNWIQYFSIFIWYIHYLVKFPLQWVFWLMNSNQGSWIFSKWVIQYWCNTDWNEDFVLEISSQSITNDFSIDQYLILSSQKIPKRPTKWKCKFDIQECTGGTKIKHAFLLDIFQPVAFCLFRIL